MFRSVRGVFCSGCSSILAILLTVSLKYFTAETPRLCRGKRRAQRRQRHGQLRGAFSCVLGFHFSIFTFLFSISLTPPLGLFCRIVRDLPCAYALRRIFLVAGPRQPPASASRGAAIPTRKIILLCCP